ncbi:methyltransferase [Clostridia bacterium]|nr:methyltransferase [Clostridia bacterium]GHV24416.1 methyltransferase [Clostridia bacterium]
MRKYQNVKIENLKPYEKNARTHNQEQIDKIQKSLEEFGFINPVLIDANFGIIAGHGRVLAAKQMGIEEVPCLFIEDLTETQKRAYIIADNKLALDAGWDEEILKVELSELNDLDFNISLTGFEINDFNFEFEDGKEILNDEFEDEPLPENPKSKHGDLYLLGNHRILCGDSTNPEDISKLMNKEVADLFLTDPPYNVDYSGGTTKIQNDNMNDEDFQNFLNLAFENANQHMKNGAVFYIWFANSNTLNFYLACQSANWKVRQQLIWVKNCFAFGRQDYQWKHEPCLYGWKDGASHRFFGGRCQSTIFENEIDILKLSNEEMQNLLKEIFEDNISTTILKENKPIANKLHPTMKPINLLIRLIENSSKPDEIVLDLFGGSGSTLIACEQLKRRCFMTEIEPKYIDVIIRRYIKLKNSADDVFLLKSDGTKEKIKTEEFLNE